jgi:hypothetical protein
MKLQLGQLQAVDMVLGQVLYDEGRIPVKIPIKTSYWLSKFITRLEKEISAFNAAKNKLALTYCIKDESGQPSLKKDEQTGNQLYQFSEDVSETVDDELLKLNQEEIEIPFNPFAIEDLGNISIAPQIIISLEKLGFIKEETKPEGE